MESETLNDFYQKYRLRTKKFAVALCIMLKKLPRSISTDVLSKQLIRSGTSVAANFRAASCARSTRELYSKMCLVVEECDETVFWLEILEETENISSEKFNNIYNESLELLKVFSASKKKLKARINSVK
jgi:four helix bundle protein